MKFTLFWILLVIAATSSGIAQDKNTQTVNKTGQELRNLTQMWDEAIVKRDIKTLGNLLSR